jgi:four helix bundle protein
LEVESEMGKGGSLSPHDLKQRTQGFALRVIRMVRALPKSAEGKILGNQVLRSATSVGANYRSAQRGKSKADFIAKLAVSEEEADETCYWLELIIAAELLPQDRMEPLLAEAKEITAILTAAGKTAKGNRK